jgi:hypothetical protein
MQQQYTVAKETLPLRFFLVASTTCTTIERNYYCIVFFCYSQFVQNIKRCIKHFRNVKKIDCFSTFGNVAVNH